MDFLQLKYYLISKKNVERSLFVKIYKLFDDENKKDKILEVSNIPFFVEETDLKKFFQSSIKISFTNKKTEKIKFKTALVEFDSKKDLKKELRLIKYANEEESLYLYSDKESLKLLTKNNCGKSLISKRFTNYIENVDVVKESIMEIVKNYNEEILVAQKKKKRRFERDDDGWTKVVRK